MSYNDLYYGPNSLKAACVNFSGYCSGVVVSPDGCIKNKVTSLSANIS